LTKYRYVTTEALAKIARRAGVRHEQKRVREAWEKGLFAIRSAGSGSGTSSYPKPDLIIFNKDGMIDLVQSKTTRKYHSYYGPADWESEVTSAQRLRELGFQARVWLDFTLFRIGRSASMNKWFRIDGHEKEFLIIKYVNKQKLIEFKWEKNPAIEQQP